MMMLICFKQHLSNIWSSLYERVKQHWGWVEKKPCLWKKRLIEKWLILINEQRVFKKKKY